MTKIGKFLKKCREDLEISQAKAAAYAGLKSPQFISNIERGTCDPSWQVLRKLMVLYKAPEKQVIDILVQQKTEYIKKKLKAQKKTAG